MSVGLYVYRILTFLFPANVYSRTYCPRLTGSESICIVCGIGGRGFYSAYRIGAILSKGPRQELGDKVCWAFDRDLIAFCHDNGKNDIIQL